MRPMLLALVSLFVAGVLAASPAAGAPAQTPKRGGTVVFGPVAEQLCLNPLKLCGIGPQFGWILAKVLPPAIERAPDSTWRPTLVSKVEVVSKRPFTLVFHIQPEARWSDRVRVTARDFVFTHEALVAAKADLGLVRSIRAVNPKALRVTLRVRTADWRLMFPYVLPRHALAGEDLARIWTDGIDNPKTGNAIGADLDEADRILDDAERARVLNRVDRQLVKDVPLIPLYQIPFVLAYKDTLRNVVPSQDNLFWNAEDWWLDR